MLSKAYAIVCEGGCRSGASVVAIVDENGWTTGGAMARSD